MGYKPGKAIIIYDADLIALINRLGRIQDLRPGAALKSFLRERLPGRIKELQAQKEPRHQQVTAGMESS